MENFRRDFLQTSRSLNGQIVDTFKQQQIQPAVNDGGHQYSNTRLTPKQPCPFHENDQFELSLSSSNFDVTEFCNSYIHLVLKLNLTLKGFDGLRTAFNVLCNNSTRPADESLAAQWDLQNALAENQFVFLGFKCSSHAISQYSFKFHDKPVSSTQQSQAITENFLYSNFRSKGEIENKKYVYSPYNEVNEYDNSTCGIYLSIKDLLEIMNNSNKYFTMDLIIPYKELLILETFDEYCNAVFGDLKLTMQITKEGMVFTEVNPLKSIRKNMLAGKLSKTVPNLSNILAVDGETLDYLHAFNQIAMTSRCVFITGWNGSAATTFESNDCTIEIVSLDVTEVYGDCKGYKIQHAAKQELENFWATNPCTYPAQKVTRNAFPVAAQADGINTNLTLALNRVTDFNLLMPVNSNQRTVFCNPALKNFQLQVGNVNYPNQSISTVSPEYFQQQMQMTDFDSIFPATDSFEHSLTDARVDDKGYLMPVTDDTSFVPCFAVERENATGIVFDGLDTTSARIELKGAPAYPNYNIYYISDNRTDSRGNTSPIKNHVPPPILCQTSDTYWIFRCQPEEGTVSCQYVTANSYDAAYNNYTLESTIVSRYANGE